MATRQCIKVSELRKIGYDSLKEWLKDPNHIYIGRNMSFYVEGAIKSKWNNPYTVKKYGRDKALELYRQLLLNNQDLLDQLPQLRDKVLGCWCKDNESCHADVLIGLLKLE